MKINSVSSRIFQTNSTKMENPVWTEPTQTSAWSLNNFNKHHSAQRKCWKDIHSLYILYQNYHSFISGPSLHVAVNRPDFTDCFSLLQTEGSQICKKNLFNTTVLKAMQQQRSSVISFVAPDNCKPHCSWRKTRMFGCWIGHKTDSSVIKARHCRW